MEGCVGEIRRREQVVVCGGGGGKTDSVTSTIQARLMRCLKQLKGGKTGRVKE